MKTKKIKQTEKNKFKIENGLFFKEDFNKLPEGTIIYIKSGLLIPTKEKEGGNLLNGRKRKTRKFR